MASQAPKVSYKMPEAAGNVVYAAVLDNGDLYFEGRRITCGSFTADLVAEQFYESKLISQDEFVDYHRHALARLNA